MDRKKSTYLLIIFILLYGITFSQSKEYSVKTALFVKILNYVNWSDETINQRKINIGLIGDSELNRILKKKLDNLKTNIGTVKVFSVNSRDEYLNCNVLIVGDISREHYSNIKDIIWDKQILSVTDQKHLFNDGVQVYLYLNEDGNIGFRINTGLLSKARLGISYHLLKYAEIVE